MIVDVILKLFSESLLSFYPAMVKYIKFPIVNQMWARFVIYAIISMFFMNYKTIGKGLFSKLGFILALVTALHVYSSYIGFNNLDAGVSYSIFYLYPLLIIIFSGIVFQWYYLLPLVGLIILTYKDWVQKSSKEVTGYIGIIIATITEAMLYFIVLNMKESNKWNILFISYLIPAIVLSIILNKRIIPERTDGKWKMYLILLLVGNAIIGSFGYYLRYYTIDKIPVSIYGMLSYFGIVMAYVYGVSLNHDKITWQKIVGSLIIIISGFFLK